MQNRPVRIFAYGSLRPGFERHDAVAEYAPKVTPATLSGYSLWLYDEGGYPVAISDDLNYSSVGYPPVVGVLYDFSLAVAEKVLGHLDRLEGVSPRSRLDHRSGVQRWLQRDVVTVACQATYTRAWCYVAGERLRALRLKGYLEFITSGDWAEFTGDLLEEDAR